MQRKNYVLYLYSLLGADERTIMLRAFFPSGVFCDTVNRLQEAIQQNQSPLWIDLLTPKKEEGKILQTLFDINIPTEDEVEEIELSSRLYQENGAFYMTALLPADLKNGTIQIEPVTFVLSKKAFVTVRYSEMPLIEICALRANKNRLYGETVNSPLASMNTVLDIIVDYIADLLEKSIAEIEAISKDLFHRPALRDPQEKMRKPVHNDLSKTLYRIGLQGEMVASLRDSLTSLSRLVGYIGKKIEKNNNGLDETVLATLEKDLLSLSDHALFIANKIGFLLEATLGMINIEQNMIIKTFSVASLIFLPPTLLASIWGMNYQNMPELSSDIGYPLALFSIALSSVIPYCYFKKKGWL